MDQKTPRELRIRGCSWCLNHSLVGGCDIFFPLVVTSNVTATFLTIEIIRSDLWRWKTPPEWQRPKLHPMTLWLFARSISNIEA